MSDGKFQVPIHENEIGEDEFLECSYLYRMAMNEGLPNNEREYYYEQFLSERRKIND